MSERQHTVDYLELPATDIGAMKDFYGAVFGWTFTDYGPDYVEFRDGRWVGGFTIATPVVRGGALLVLYSNNLEGSERQVRARGGKVVKPIFAFPGGRRFHFLDPSGNELAVWSDAGGGGS